MFTQTQIFPLSFHSENRGVLHMFGITSRFLTDRLAVQDSCFPRSAVQKGGMALKLILQIYFSKDDCSANRLHLNWLNHASESGFPCCFIFVIVEYREGT